MSNKTTLQSNNALISQNNTDLQALINTANALPEAGSGSGDSGVETCTVTIVNNSDKGFDCYGTWYDGTILSYGTNVPDGDSTTITAIKNSFIAIPSANVSTSAGWIDEYTIGGASIIRIQDANNVTITIG